MTITDQCSPVNSSLVSYDYIGLDTPCVLSVYICASLAHCRCNFTVLCLHFRTCLDYCNAIIYVAVTHLRIDVFLAIHR